MLKGDKKLTRYHLVRRPKVCLITRFDGHSPGMAKIFTTPAPRPCSAHIPCPFSPPTDSLKVLSAYSPLHRFFRLYLGIISRNEELCQQYFLVFLPDSPLRQISVYRSVKFSHLSCFGKKGAPKKPSKGALRTNAPPLQSPAASPSSIQKCSDF